MKQCLPVLFLLGVVQLTMGQSKTQPAVKSFRDLPACDCSVFSATKRAYIPDSLAQRTVGDMLESIKKNTRISFNDRILIREANCPSPVALLCPTTLPNGRQQDERVILYNNQFLRDIARTDTVLTWTDRQVLAHEIGHHVFGHLVNEKTIAALEKQYKADVRDNVTAKNNKVESDARLPKLTNQQIANLHAQEIQADFFSIWLLHKTNRTFDFETFANSFDLINIVQKEQKFGKEYTLTHPLFRERLDAMRNFQAKIQTDSRRRMVARLGYFASAASAAYINLNPEKPYYDIAFVAGLTVAGQPRFSIDGAPVSAILYNPKDALNTYLGLSFSRFRWQKPLRVEGEVAWSKQRYGTLLGSGNTQQLLETIELRYLSVFPKITWRPGGLRNNNGFSTSRLAFFASCGPMVRIPLGIDYQNHGAMVSPENRPTAALSVSPRVSVGIELLRKTFLPRGYKLSLSYELQRIRLNANPRPSTVSHNIDATLYYTFLRR